MPELEMDKRTTALVVIDLQKGIASMGTQFAPYSADVVIQNAAKIAEAFRRSEAMYDRAGSISEKQGRNLVEKAETFVNQAKEILHM
ncbi:MAG: hypothetical protein KGI25_04915 [Thaumarchaeota archaeon]|nr:hypothetical protein [Nitrososphaerota archaeon]